MSDYEIFEVPNFLLQKGGILPTARRPTRRVGR
jgi:hypothetical protein